MLDSKSRIAVVGQGYVGLPLAMAAAERFENIIGVDSSQSRIDQLSSGFSPVEDITHDTVARFVKSGIYRPTSDYNQIADFDVAVITVPSPLKDGLPDLSFIESASQNIGKHVSKNSVVILESTTYPGTTDQLLQPILEKESGLKAGVDFFLGYSPERIDPGNKDWNLLNTPKIVSGVNEESLSQVSSFYQRLGIPTVPVSGTREAEMVKLLENTFRHVNIALVNELAEFSQHLQVDIWEAISAAETKPFGFMKFLPGPGVGGHCLPVDPSYLAWAIKETAGREFEFVKLANEVNKGIPKLVAARSESILLKNHTPVEGSKVLLVGLAYKPGTGDTREAPSINIAAELRARGAELYGLDAHVKEALWPNDILVADLHSQQRFDLTIFVTHHPEIDYEDIIRKSNSVLDSHNILHGENVERLW